MRSVKRNLSASRTMLFSILLFLIMVVGSLASLPAHAMVIENTQCILGQPGSPNGLNCTANDIQLSSPQVTILDGCDYPGDTATLQVLVDVTNTAQLRYDIGVWLSVDGDPNGDGSETGICSVLTIPLYTNPPTNTIQLLDVANEWVNRNGNACGDVKNQPTPNPPPATNPNADIRNVNMGTVSLLCEDSDGDGQINVPVIIAWDNLANSTCNVATDALPGTAAKCSANNDLNLPVPVPARLIVNKDTVPNDPMLFGFNLSGSASPVAGGFDGDYDFDLADNGTFDSGSGVFTGGLPAGSYVLVENATPGWQSTGTCSSDVDGLNTDPALLDLRPGETVTCDYVNVPTTGTLTVRKTTTGGTTGAFDFDVSDSNGTVASPNIDTSVMNPNDSTPIVVDISETYTVTETLDPAFILTSAVCTNGNADPVGTPNLQAGTVSGITVLPGDDITCAFTNAPAGSVGITKVSVGGNDTFGFNTTVPLPNVPDGNFTLMTVNGTGSLAVPNVQPSTPTYDLTETTIPSGWRFGSAVCLDGNQVNVSSGTQPAQGVRFTHAVSQTTNCTVTNVKLGTIVINKLTNPGGNVTDSFGFTSNAPGFASFSLMDGGSQSIINVPVNSDPVLTTAYTVTEDDPSAAGFDLTGLTCSSTRGDALSTGSVQTRVASINIRAGETVTCTFTNTERATITVEKQISGTNPNNLSTVFGFTTDFSAGFDLNPGVGVPDSSIAYEVTPGQPYAITETDPYNAGWSLISATCLISGEVASLAAGMLSNIVPQPGDDLTCTFINAPLGSASIVKNAVGGDGVFGFIGSEEPFNNGGAGFLIDTTVSNSADFTNQLFPNIEYDVQENIVPANWTLTSVVCSDPTGNSTPTGNEDPQADPLLGAIIRAASDETVTCTFTNEADAQLTINKVTVPASDVTTEFAFTGTGDINGSDLVGGGSVSTMAMAGTFVAEETPTAGWALTNIQCTGVAAQKVTIGGTAGFVAGDTDVSLDLDPGDDATCTFTNTQLGSITITKATVGDTGSFTFQGTDSNDAGIITSPFNLTTAGAPGDETVTYNGLLPGQYQFSETVPAGWMINGTGGDIVCTGQTTSTATPGSNSVGIVLADGEDLSCTFTNTKLASLALVKSVTNDHGGTATATDWTLTATGGTNLSGDGGVAATFVALGDYVLAESAGPAGYTAGAWSCDDGTLNGATLTLAAGDVAVCTIVNDDDAASLALTKIVTNDSGGTAVAADWMLNAAGPTPLNGAGGFAATPVSAGDYTLTETGGPSGYTASVWSCTGGALNGNVLTLALGETASCSITNNDDAASLALVKNVTNNNGGTAVAADWTLNAAGPTPLSGAGGVAATPVNAGDYTLTETGGPSGYSASAWSCTAGTLNGNVLTLALGETASCSITNDDEAARLDLTKIVVNDDGGSAVETDWTLSAAGPTPLSGAGGVAATPVDAGDYTLSESAGPDGYTAGAWQCNGGALNGNVLTLGNGETASCSITNDDDAAGINLAKTVNGPATLEANGTYTVVYTITATNSGGAGTYNLVDTFSPGTGITLNTANAVYVPGTENDQSGALGVYPNFVTNEGLGTGLNESWTVTANFIVDPVTVDPNTSQCDPANPVINTGFYNAVSGSATDPNPDDNDTCTDLPDPAINLAKTVNGPATLENNGSYTVVYTITATNSAGPGSYNLIDTFSPGTGITLNTANAVYVPGTENDQSGTLGVYPNFVTDEGLGAGLNESWTVTANFTVNPVTVDPNTSQCDPANPVINTGFYNAVSGSSSDTDPDDNDTCTGLPTAGLTLVKVLNGSGPAIPADFALTLTGADGVHNSGLDYTSGDQPPVLVGVPYQVTEAPGQVADYLLQGIQCVDNGNQAVLAQPFTLADEQRVTCRVTNYPTDIPPPAPTYPVPVDNKLALLLLVLLLMATGLYMRPAMTRKL